MSTSICLMVLGVVACILIGAILGVRAAMKEFESRYPIESFSAKRKESTRDGII